MKKFLLEKEIFKFLFRYKIKKRLNDGTKKEGKEKSC